MSKLIFYAGIGSRETPADVRALMTNFAAHLRGAGGYVLRSGHAKGADQAFEAGATNVAEVYLPWPGYNDDTKVKAFGVFDDQDDAAFQIASQYHPAWERCSPGAKRMHARNAHIILGAGLDKPVDFVLCWTPLQDGVARGGTALGIAIADGLGIPVHNLISDKVVEMIRNAVKRPVNRPREPEASVA